MPDGGGPEPRMPDALPLPSMRLASENIASSYDALERRPSDPEAHTEPAPAEAQEGRPRAHRRRLVERTAEVLIAGSFIVSFLGSVLFCCAYVLVNLHASDLGQLQNLLLGTGLGIAMLGLCGGLGLWSKSLSPRVKSVQDRPVHHSPEEHEIAAEEILLGGVEEAGIAQRRFLRRTLLAALAALPLPFVFALRDSGPRLGRRLQVNSWRRDVRLVDAGTGEPVKAGDLEPGGVMTVVPEGATDTTEPVNAESVVLLIRLPPGVNKPLRGRGSWAAADHVAYSKICTHAGCPVGLFEQETRHLLCPCHQSTFDAGHGCTVLFGPAPRPLPQLPIYIDGEGYLRAQRAFDVPLGPSFWERDAK